MKNQSVLFSIAAAALLFGAIPTIQAGTATKVIKKTAGVTSGAVAVASVLYTSGYGADLLISAGDCVNKVSEEMKIVTLLAGLLLASPVIAIDEHLSNVNKHLSLAVQLACIASAAHISYKLLKPSVDEQEGEEGYSY